MVIWVSATLLASSENVFQNYDMQTIENMLLSFCVLNAIASSFVNQCNNIRVLLFIIKELQSSTKDW